MAKIYADPIHFKDSTGKLRDIDNKIVSDATGFRNGAGPNEVKFSRRSVMPPPFTGARNCSPGPDGTDGFSTKTTYDARDLVSSTITRSDGKYRRSSYVYFTDGQLKESSSPAHSASTNPTGASGIVQKASYQRYANNRISAFIDEEGDQTDVVHTPHGLPSW